MREVDRVYLNVDFLEGGLSSGGGGGGGGKRILIVLRMREYSWVYQNVGLQEFLKVDGRERILSNVLRMR